MLFYTKKFISKTSYKNEASNYMGLLWFKQMFVLLWQPFKVTQNKASAEQITQKNRSF